MRGEDPLNIGRRPKGSSMMQQCLARLEAATNLQVVVLPASTITVDEIDDRCCESLRL